MTLAAALLERLAVLMRSLHPDEWTLFELFLFFVALTVLAWVCTDLVWFGCARVIRAIRRYRVRIILRERGARFDPSLHMAGQSGTPSYRGSAVSRGPIYATGAGVQARRDDRHAPPVASELTRHSSRAASVTVGLDRMAGYGLVVSLVAKTREEL